MICDYQLTVQEEGEDMLQTGSKEELAEQFKHIMMERFLGGQDGDHISYLDIDNNEQYDDLVLRFLFSFACSQYYICMLVGCNFGCPFDVYSNFLRILRLFNSKFT